MEVKMSLSKDDIVDCLAIAVAVFPNYPLEDSTITAYHLLLDDLEKNDLYSAIQEVLKTSPFFPTVAQILEVANRKPTYTPPRISEVKALDSVVRRPMPEGFRQMVASFGKLPEE